MSWWIDESLDTADVEPKPITIVRDSVEQTSFACPTIFDMVDDEGTNYYFRLRNGFFRFVNEDTGEPLASGPASYGLDGVCDFDEALDMIQRDGSNVVTDE